MGFSTWNTPPKIKTWKVEGKFLTLPRGAMPRVRATFKHSGIRFKVKDRRIEGSPVAFPLVYKGFPLRPYQVGGSKAALKYEQGIVRAATGSGKTITALQLATRFGLNTLVIVPNVKLMRQWNNRAIRDLGLAKENLGVIRGKVKKLFPLTVVNQQSLFKKIDDDIKEFFGAVIMDEAHHAAAKTHNEVIDQFPSRYRIAFSADETRSDKKEFLTYDAFGEVVHETDRATCEKYKAIVDVEIRIVITEFEASWYRWSEDPQKFQLLLDEMVPDKKRNRLITRIAANHIRAGDQVIALTHRREHARNLDRILVAKGFRSGCMLGGKDAGDFKEFDKTSDGILSGEVRAGIGTYEAIGEGIDLPEVAIGIATTPIASNKQRFNQVRGRLCRPAQGKDKGILYTIHDPLVFSRKKNQSIIQNIIKWNRTVKIQLDGEWVDARKHRHVIM